MTRSRKLRVTPATYALNHSTLSKRDTIAINAVPVSVRNAQKTRFKSQMTIKKPIEYVIIASLSSKIRRS